MVSRIPLGRLCETKGTTLRNLISWNELENPNKNPVAGSPLCRAIIDDSFVFIFGFGLKWNWRFGDMDQLIFFLPALVLFTCDTVHIFIWNIEDVCCEYWMNTVFAMVITIRSNTIIPKSKHDNHFGLFQIWWPVHASSLFQGTDTSRFLGSVDQVNYRQNNEPIRRMRAMKWRFWRQSLVCINERWCCLPMIIELNVSTWVMLFMLSKWCRVLKELRYLSWRSKKFFNCTIRFSLVNGGKLCDFPAALSKVFFFPDRKP